MGTIKPKGINWIAKIGYVHICLREENLSLEIVFLSKMKVSLMYKMIESSNLLIVECISSNHIFIDILRCLWRWLRSYLKWWTMLNVMNGRFAGLFCNTLVVCATFGFDSWFLIGSYKQEVLVSSVVVWQSKVIAWTKYSFSAILKKNPP